MSLTGTGRVRISTSEAVFLLTPGAVRGRGVFGTSEDLEERLDVTLLW